MAQDTALHLFQIAALMLGDEQEAALVVEEIVAGVEADPCANATAAHDEAHSRLVQGRGASAPETACLPARSPFLRLAAGGHLP